MSLNTANVNPAPREVKVINLVGNIEQFQPGNNFRAYCDRLNQYFIINNVEANKKAAFFVTMCGSHTYEILMSLCIPKLPSELEYNEIITLLNSYFDPKRNKRAERYKFNKCYQEEGEAIGDFIVKLKSLAQSCEFGDIIPNDTTVPNTSPAVNSGHLKLALLNEALADRFIIGLRNEKIQQALLNHLMWNFEQCVEKAMSMEIVEKEQRSMVGLSQNAIFNGQNRNQTSQNGSKQIFYKKSGNFKNNCSIKFNQKSQYKSGPSKKNNDYKSGKCKHCGRGHNEESCPAKNWECFVCHKKGHTSVVCPEKSQSKVNMICNMSNGSQPVISCICVQNQQLDMEVDTGACASIISEKEYMDKFYKNSNSLLNKNINVNLLTVLGSPIMVKGELKVKVSHANREFSLQLMVIKGDYPSRAIIGRDWLDILFSDWRSWYNCNAIYKVDKEDSLLHLIKMKFPKLLQHNLNEPIKDFEVSVVLKEGKIPKFCAAYNVPFSLRDRVETEIKRLCNEQILIPVSYSKYASPVVVVPKANGEVRMCLDGKVNLNQCLESQHYPLPLIDDILVEMQGCKFFCLIDMTGAYLQVKVDEESQKYLVINTSLGLFAYTRLPFGISIASSAFQSILDQILKNIKGVKAFQDDIILGAENEKDLKIKLFEVLGRLSDYNVKINLEKCKLMVDNVNYLGYNLSGNGIKPTVEKIREISDAPVPQNITQLQAYLGLLNFYRKFIANLSTELRPLYELLKKNVKFDWNQNCQNAFERSKKLMNNSGVLEIYDPKKEIVLCTDASPYGVACCLAHVVNGFEKPVMFASSTLSPAEKNYSQLHREALAIIYAIRKFNKYLFGREFTIYTDNCVIKEIFTPNKGTSSVAAARLQRWSIELSMYQYKIKHRSAKNMSHVDALSRLPLSDATNVEYLSINFFCKNDEKLVDIDLIKKEMQKDIDLIDVYNFTKNGWSSKYDKKLEPFYKKRNCLSIENNCIYYGNRLVIPQNIVESVLKILHESHMGIVKMKMLTRAYVWWPNCDIDIEEYVNTCNICQSTRDNTNKKLKSSKWFPTTYPFERVHIDFFDFAGKKLLLLVDTFSRFIDIKIMNSSNAYKLIEKLMKTFSYFGYPKQIVSDNGPPFNSHIFIKFCRLNGISVFKSPPYHPQSNGIAERGVRSVKNVFKKYCIMNQVLSVEERMNKFLLFYRNTPTSVNGKTPSSILFAFKPRIVLDLLSKKKSCKKYYEQHKKIKHDKIVHKQEKVVKKNNVKEKEYQINDNVMYLNHFKSHVKWLTGKILKVLSKFRYLILIEGQVRYVHKNQIREHKLSDKFHLTDGRFSNYNGNNFNDLDKLETKKQTQESEDKCLNKSKAIIVNDQSKKVSEHSGALVTGNRPKRNIKPPRRFSHAEYKM